MRTMKRCWCGSHASQEPLFSQHAVRLAVHHRAAANGVGRHPSIPLLACPQAQPLSWTSNPAASVLGSQVDALHERASRSQLTWSRWRRAGAGGGWTRRGSTTLHPSMVMLARGKGRSRASFWSCVGTEAADNHHYEGSLCNDNAPNWQWHNVTVDESDNDNTWPTTPC